jgi:hypothetical protein
LQTLSRYPNPADTRDHDPHDYTGVAIDRNPRRLAAMA